MLSLIFFLTHSTPLNDYHELLFAVDRTKEMLGTFSPQQELYTHEIPEDTTPSGILARGSYSARTKVKFQFISYNLAEFVISRIF